MNLSITKLFFYFFLFLSIFNNINNTKTFQKNNQKINIDKEDIQISNTGDDPMINIGVLSLDFSPTMVKQITNKIEKQEYNDFIFPGTNPVDINVKKIQDFSQEMSSYTFVATSYFKFLYEYNNVEITPLNLNTDINYLIEQISSLDGILFTGGSAPFVEETINIRKLK